MQRNTIIMKCVIYHNALDHANCPKCKVKIMFKNVKRIEVCDCEIKIPVLRVENRMKTEGCYVVQYGKVSEYMYQ